MRQGRRRQQQKQARKARLGRLPKSINLGRGYVVRVFLVTPAQILDMLDGEEKDAVAGFWDDEEFAIYVDSTVSRRRQWEIYFHELQHAVHDVSELNRGGI